MIQPTPLPATARLRERVVGPGGEEKTPDTALYSAYVSTLCTVYIFTQGRAGKLAREKARGAIP